MRVVLVGRPDERARLRRALVPSGIEIAGEADTPAAARALPVTCDAFLVAAAARPREVPEPLTPREREVLEIMAEGLPNKAIAARLGISDQTVKFHVAAICGKLGAINRTEAVRIGIQRGWIAV
jgi:DNA-binding NarL/FixJ family response regulator